MPEQIFKDMSLNIDLKAFRIIGIYNPDKRRDYCVFDYFVGADIYYRLSL